MTPWKEEKEEKFLSTHCEWERSMLFIPHLPSKGVVPGEM